MRLTTHQITIIKNAAQSVLGADAQVILFGSRVNDALRGGDIDSLVESQSHVANKTQAIGQIYAKLIRQLGDRKIDIIINDSHSEPSTVIDMAKETGVQL